jgi:hypothetical protein
MILQINNYKSCYKYIDAEMNGLQKTMHWFFCFHGFRLSKKTSSRSSTVLLIIVFTNDNNIYSQ